MVVRSPGMWRVVRFVALMVDAVVHGVRKVHGH